MELEIKYNLQEILEELQIIKRELGTTEDIKYMNKKETCKYLDISNNTLDKWLVLGLPCICIGGVMRFKKASIDEWMQKQYTYDYSEIDS